MVYVQIYGRSPRQSAKTKTTADLADDLMKFYQAPGNLRDSYIRNLAINFSKCTLKMHKCNFSLICLATVHSYDLSLICLATVHSYDLSLICLATVHSYDLSLICLATVHSRPPPAASLVPRPATPAADLRRALSNAMSLRKTRKTGQM